MDVQPPSSNVGELVTKFYQLLTRYETFPAAKNFFLVKIESVPSTITDDNIRKLGFGQINARGIDMVKSQFEPLISGNEYTLIATGVDTNTEKTNTESQSEKYKNGLLPTGPYTTGHEYNDTDLDIQFLETNISFLDGVIRPWIQLYSVYGNMQLNEGDPKLTTNIDIFFISKQLPKLEAQINKEMLRDYHDTDAYGIEPVIRKTYKYYDCIPHEITSAGVSEYTGDIDIGSIATKWRFSKFDVITPGYLDTPWEPIRGAMDDIYR